MSLIDADKLGFERDNPAPNGHDLVIAGAVKATGTTSVNYATDATTGGFSTSTIGTLRIIASGTIQVNRTAGNTSAVALISAPIGANAFFAWGTLSNASPQLTYPLNYYAPNGTGGILWGIRAYYDASVGVIKIFNESYDSGVTASEYDVTVKYYLLHETLT